MLDTGTRLQEFELSHFDQSHAGISLCVFEIFVIFNVMLKLSPFLLFS